MDAVESVGDSLAGSLQESLERLTREAKADMADLERHLQADGIDTPAVVRNSGAPVDMDMAFQVARQEAGALVLGQEEFLDSLLIAYKRPFVAGSQEGAPPVSYTHLPLWEGRRATGRYSPFLCRNTIGRQASTLAVSPLRN